MRFLLVMLLLAQPVFAQSVSYRCEGEILELFSGQTYGGIREYTSKETISLSVFKDSVQLSGTSIFFPVPNYITGKWGSLTICSSVSTEIVFDNYGCDVEKNLEPPSIEVTEGSFNKTLNQLTLRQARKYKRGVERMENSYTKQGIFQCSIKQR